MIRHEARPRRSVLRRTWQAVRECYSVFPLFFQLGAGLLVGALANLLTRGWLW